MEAAPDALRPQVRALKEKIEAEKGSDAFPVAGQKLIYAGKILSDDVPICEYRIDEKNFVVVMVTKVEPLRHAPAPKPGPPLPPPQPLTTPSCRPSRPWAPQPPRLELAAPRSLPRHQGPPRPLMPSPRCRPPPARSHQPTTSLRSPSRSPLRGKGGQSPKEGGIGGVGCGVVCNSVRPSVRRMTGRGETEAKCLRGLRGALGTSAGEIGGRGERSRRVGAGAEPVWGGG